ncbi:hypothetical protein QJS10_CPB13g00126 [Acorus calamus]|uniref:Uncharacterized protein n=1 Tax=Acorus calamus TaxID=4465 RepID=A0AAV9DGU4_ACOCL|nr:hypothetical protein QJS10_CPB13g00126 [Acorus calamus]
MVGTTINGRSSTREALPTAKVIHVDGTLLEYPKPTTALQVVLHNPNHYLCHSESMHVDCMAPHVPEEEELLPGQLYFLIPLHRSHVPLSLPDLCELAVLAGDALRRRRRPHSSLSSSFRLSCGFPVGAT